MIVDIIDVPFIDITAMFTLIDFIVRLKSEKVNTIIISTPSHQKQLENVDKNDMLIDVIFYKNIKDALKNL